MTTWNDMDAMQERVIKLEARTDRHGEALSALEAAARDSERKLSQTAEQLQSMITTGRTAIWVVGVFFVASQSGILAAIKAALGM